MPKIHDLASTITVARAEIPVDTSSNIQQLAAAFVAGIVWGRDTQGSPDILFGLKINEVKQMVESVLAGAEITHEDIRTVLEWYGRSLVDLWADYAPEFLVWFRENHKEIFDPWLQIAGKYLPLPNETFNDEWIQSHQGKIAQELLFSFTNNTLNGAVYDTYDAMLVEFCKTCPKAKRHIHILLEEFEERGTK